MSNPFGLISDQHYNNWSQFGRTIGLDYNSRLKIQLETTLEAAKAMKAAGCEYLFCAGDTFHVRGTLLPSVLNYVTETYKQIINEIGLKVVMLAGNHDLETNASVYSSNASSSLAGIGVHVVCGAPYSVKVGDVTIHLVSWRESYTELLVDLKQVRAEAGDGIHDLIIHAGINNAIPTMPNTGIDAEDLKALGFRNVYAGHYHNHREILPGVISIGALNHQQWSDVGSIAGYMIVNADGTFKQYETSSPKFIALEGEISEEDLKGNYVRYRAEVESDEEAAEIRSELDAIGAAGVVTAFVRKRALAVSGPSTADTRRIDSLGESISSYCKAQHEKTKDFDLTALDSLCREILMEAESAGASD